MDDKGPKALGPWPIIVGLLITTGFCCWLYFLLQAALAILAWGLK